MNNSVIADSSGLISLASTSDLNHQKALDISTNQLHTNGSIIVPGDVFSETVNIAGKKMGHQTALGTAEALLNTDGFYVFDTNEQLRKQALAILKNQAESVSFTDCMVMAVANHFNTKYIFGFDEVFHKNGYIRLGIDSK